MASYLHAWFDQSSTSVHMQLHASLVPSLLFLMCTQKNGGAGATYHVNDVSRAREFRKLIERGYNVTNAYSASPAAQRSGASQHSATAYFPRRSYFVTFEEHGRWLCDFCPRSIDPRYVIHVISFTRLPLFFCVQHWKLGKGGWVRG